MINRDNEHNGLCAAEWAPKATVAEQQWYNPPILN